LSGLRWREAQQAWEGGEIVGGVDFDWTKGETLSVPPGAGPTLSFGPETFRLWSAYAGVKHTMKLGEGLQFTPSMGARYYQHEVFGDQWTPQVSGVLEAGAWRIHASANRAANFPGLEVAAFSTVAIPALGQTWRTLRPERLDQLEAGVRYTFAPAAAIELTVFRNRARDRFVFVPPPPPPFRFQNVERFTTAGAELTATVQPNNSLSLFAGISRLNVTPADLPYAPRWSLAGGATWQIASALRLNVDGSYVSEQRSAAQSRAAGAPNVERLPAFALVNARLAYEFLRETRRKAEVFVAAENLLDRDYRYRPGYPMPGTGLTFGINGQF
jgi:iron complex outermembrane receptor protein